MLKAALQDTWIFFKLHYLALSAIILPIVVPVAILRSFYDYNFTSPEFVLFEQIPPLVLGVLTYPVYSAGVIFYIASVVDGKIIDTKAAWRLGVKFWGPYLIVSVLVAVAVAGGIMLLIIPGIIFAIRFAFSEFDLLLNNTNPPDAMKNSWRLTRPYMFVLLGGFAIIGLILFAPYYGALTFFEETQVLFRVVDTVLGMVYAVLETLFSIFAFRVYDDARGQSNRVFEVDGQ